MRIDGIRHGTVYIIGEEDLKSNKRCLTKEDSEGILFIANTNIEGIFFYGYEQKKSDYFGHGPGYIWSSRASVMNANFDVALIEACYKKEGSSYCCCSIDLARLEPLLKDTEYEIDWTPYPSEDGTDVHYKLKKKEVNQ